MKCDEAKLLAALRPDSTRDQARERVAQAAREDREFAERLLAENRTMRGPDQGARRRKNKSRDRLELIQGGKTDE